MKVKLNVDLGGFKAGTILKGKILNSLYWRNRIKDSVLDNCLTIIKSEFVVGKDVDKKEDKKNIKNLNRRINK